MGLLSFKPLQSGAMVHCRGDSEAVQCRAEVSNPFRAGQWFTEKSVQKVAWTIDVSNPFRAGQWFTVEQI